MPTFNFSLAFSKKKEKKTSKNNNRSKIIEKDIIGVIFITIDANYEVEIKGNRYDIKNECYTCKGYTHIYTHLCNYNKWTCIIRTPENSFERNINYYLPFVEGCCVKGDIIQDNVFNKKVFLIKDIYQDYENPVTLIARKFYNEHYEEINKAIINKRNNATY